MMKSIKDISIKQQLRKTNRIMLTFSALSILLLFLNCESTAPEDKQKMDNQESSLDQYTPDQADWSTFNSKPFEGAVNTGHDPDGVGWLTKEWPKWDGTVFNPSTMSKAEFHAALFPNGGDQLIGLRDVFYEHYPFTDNKNPTKAEVDEWHRIAINHLRALVGYTSEDRKVKPDHSLFLRAHWSDERKFTTMWDEDYPGEEGSAYGPCQNSTNAHCGATFIPSKEDQAPYLPDGIDEVVIQAGSEGVFSSSKSNIPWSIKFSRCVSYTLSAEGFWGGHTGPWFHREKFGFSFWDSDPSNNNSIAVLRAKWGGTLMPNLYTNPDN